MITVCAYKQAMPYTAHIINCIGETNVNGWYVHNASLWLGHFHISTFLYFYISAFLHLYISAFLHLRISAFLHFCIYAFLHFGISAFLHFCISALSHIYLHFCISAFLHFCISAFLHFCIATFLLFYISTFLYFPLLPIQYLHVGPAVRSNATKQQWLVLQHVGNLIGHLWSSIQYKLVACYTAKICRRSSIPYTHRCIQGLEERGFDLPTTYLQKCYTFNRSWRQ